jgi:hypothetical protein
MTIYIDQETGKRVNIYAPYKGRSKLNTPEIRAAVGVIEIEDDPKPADFTYDDYEVKEDWETNQRPYTIYTKKSPEQLAEIRWSKLKQKRDEITENGGCLVQGKWFHTDTKSKQQQMALKEMGQELPINVMWKTMDGTFIQMTPALAQELFLAQVMREMQIFGICETKRLDDTPINDGWPQTYADTLESVE